MELTMFGVKATYKIKSLKTVNKDIQWLEPVLAQWLKIHRDYIEDVDCEDNLYWYNERANVSVFAGAVWKCGGIALEEYSAIKSDENENSKKGRIDLYLSSHNNSAVCEAKITWIYLCDPNRQQKNFSNTISDAIKSASTDVSNTLKPNDNSLGIALNFIVAYSKDDIDASNSLSDLQKAIKDSECDFYAWLELEKDHEILCSKKFNHNFVAVLGTVQRQK
jgi:hypothetical protein